MIRVDRSRVPRPAVLDSQRAVKEREAATRFYTERWNPEGSRAQQRFDFKTYREPEVRAALVDLFHGKCAYCESRFGSVTPGDVEQYRPKASVAESSGHPGYWWLASDWDNLLIACPDCNRVRIHAGERAGKANRFPLVDEAMRAWTPGKESGEQPLLLDPCRDEPEEHLVFDASGQVVSDTARGQTTISVLGLNRPGLADARREVAARIAQLAAMLDAELLATADSRVHLRGVAQDLTELVEETQEYAALKRQLVRPILERLVRQGALDDVEPQLTLGPKITQSRHRAAKTSFRKFAVEQSNFSLANERGRATYRSERRMIESVVIHNVKAIRHLELDLTDPGSGRTPWLMLLGENGTGKSTILQSIALTLIGAAGIARLGQVSAIRPADFVRYRCKTASVSVKMTGFVGPHRLTFDRERKRIEFTSPTGERSTVSFRTRTPVVRGVGWEPQTVLLGYGATRLLPRHTLSSAGVGDRFSRVDNLFDPYVPLLDAERWLRTRKGVEFRSAVLVLKDLLSLGPDARLEVEGKQVTIVQHRDRVPLRVLSDGYQSVVATAIDIFEVLTRLWHNLDDAEGIVLLDELGAHLHPTWKMQIVESMRKALPGVQFVTSTHDPLCLRGLTAGEVIVMQRDEQGRVEALTKLPSPGDFRVDQLLTSDFFGLNSTTDPETDRDFDEYYALLALRVPTPVQSARIRELRDDLDRRRYMGTTLRESLMYEAVDRIVAEHKRSPGRTITQLKQETIDAVARIWAGEGPTPTGP